MTTELKRYWFEFDFSEGEHSYGWNFLPFNGCGITAYDYDDALRIMRRFLLRGEGMPKFTRVIENVDVSTLDKKHVLPNSGVPVWRGVWYPAYNMWWGPYNER
ncbi:MAG TPA: hypothetical protein VE732_06750 [Nitrososphaera sp.]|jgi:hypothetical protein|nr:hypothetical protein [Nitrososphaera sp.]